MTGSRRSGEQRLARILRSIVAALATFAVSVLGLIAFASPPASAHVSLTLSDPSNVSTLAGPVDQIRFTFSGPVEPVADRFELRDASGTALGIASVTTDGDNVVVLTPTEAMPPGRNKATWALRGSDGHSMTGAIAFTVSTAVGTTLMSEPGATVTESVVIASDASVGAPEPPSVGTQDSMDTAELVAALARWIVYSAVLFCVGGLGYLGWVHRGSAAEGRQLVFYVRRAALIIVVFSALEWATQLIVYDFGQLSALIAPSVWIDLLWSGFGVGILFRVAGAGLVISFLKIDIDRDSDGTRFDPIIEAPGEVATKSPLLTRLRVEASPFAFVGAFLLLVSELFIGHTSSTEPRLLVGAGNMIHMAAGGMWAAGSFMLASTLWRRHRRGAPLDARLLATRFSVLAAWSLVAVAVSGVVLAWTIIGSIGGLWQTDFGRLLLVKVAFVAGVAAMGAYNHRVLVPALVADTESDAVRFRRAITFEAALFSVILLLTSLLVVANPG